MKKDKLRLEAYVENLFNDRTIENLSKFSDLFDVAGGYSHSSIGIALPELREVGARASYTF